ncbi:MAG: ABC-2 type transport system permease protein [Phormidesmis priestleyi Ana]|uniref:ABC-2 type transport system permease protein n=1 Tax=Phormidesmis priestleyi Ana TaxID=1666911 RepID=A0A0P8A3M4_9CYAN|nr:MAG: ABC-2 type transport system permease protein [Phormidesmis priestleyi Ana]
MIDLLIGEFKRTWIQTRRYPAEVIGGIVILTSVFYGIFVSSQYMAGPTTNFGNRLDAIVVGYVIWTLVLYIVNDIANNLQLEAQTGTLEQVFLSPFGAPRVFLARAVASLTLRLMLIMIVMVIIMFITGSQLAFPVLLLLPLATLLLSAYGLAFFIGSFALVLKKVQQVLGLFQFVLLFLLLAPTETWVGGAKLAAYMMPIVPSIGLLRDLMARNEGLDWGVWAIALANGLFYFTLGTLVFRWAEGKAKRQGSLGGY